MKGITRVCVPGLVSVLVLSVVCLWSNCTTKEASAIIVPDDYSTIQEAINNAADGDTVFVKSGTYYEHVVVNRRLSLVGEDADTTVIDGNHTGHIFHVVSSFVSITGFTVQHSGNVSWPPLDAGICINRTTDCNVSGNRLIDNGYAGISLRDSQHNLIASNNVSRSGYDGIHLMNSSRNNVSWNILDSNSGGINGHFNSDNNSITGNAIMNSTYGMSYDASDYNSICGNNISGNYYGLYLHSCSNNLVFNNNLVSNTEHASLSPLTSTVWDNDYPSGGNYWSDYNGSDCRNGPSQNLAGCDGIGDTPNVLDSSNRDNYPLMKPIPWDSDDIGVTCLGKVGPQGVSIMKTVIAQGIVVHFSVFVMNYGNGTENLNVTTYINATLLETQTGITVSSRGYAIVNFTWNTSSFDKGSYLISVEVAAVPDEIEVDNNIRACSVVLGTIGDVNSDGTVNMSDIYDIALSYGGRIGQAHCVSNYDIDDNGVINMLDLYVAAIHYGQTDLRNGRMVS